MGNSKQDIISKIEEHFTKHGHMVVGIDNRHIKDKDKESRQIIKSAMNLPRSVDLKCINGNSKIVHEVLISDEEDGVFIVRRKESKEFAGVIARQPGKGSATSGNHFYFPKRGDHDKARELIRELRKMN